MRNPHIGRMDVMHLMKGCWDSRSPATEVLVSVKFLWDTVAVERSGFWERRKNRTRFSFTNKTTTVLTLKENATWQFSWAQGSTSRSPNWPPKKSSNYYWHRAIAASTAMSVTGVVPWSLSRPAIWSTKGMSIHSPNKALKLWWVQSTWMGTLRPTYQNAKCMCHLCFVDGCSLAPCGHRMCHIGHFICKRSKDQSSSPPQSQNITTKTMSYSATRKALLTPDRWHFCICQCFPHCSSPRRHAWSAPCVVQSKALIWRLTPENHTHFKMTGPFSLQIYLDWMQRFRD